jgi:hypothetical protein
MRQELKAPWCSPQPTVATIHQPHLACALCALLQKWVVWGNFTAGAAGVQGVSAECVGPDNVPFEVRFGNDALFLSSAFHFRLAVALLPFATVLDHTCAAQLTADLPRAQRRTSADQPSQRLRLCHREWHL